MRDFKTYRVEHMEHGWWLVEAQDAEHAALLCTYDLCTADEEKDMASPGIRWFAVRDGNTGDLVDHFRVTEVNQ